MTAIFGPSIGPSIGGWLTDNWGWQWIFFINLPPGLALIGIIYGYLEQDPMHLDRLADMDYFGIVTMAMTAYSLVWYRAEEAGTRFPG